MDLTEYIKNENLLEFSYKMIELSRKQNEAGASFVLYGENNVFGRLKWENSARIRFLFDFMIDYSLTTEDLLEEETICGLATW